MLAFGQQRFVAGPARVVAELIAECCLERIFLYHSDGSSDMHQLIAFAEILKKKDAQCHPEHLEAMKLSLALDLMQPGVLLRVVCWLRQHPSHCKTGDN